MKLQLGLIISSVYDAVDYLDFIIPSHRCWLKENKNTFRNSVISRQGSRENIYFVGLGFQNKLSPP